MSPADQMWWFGVLVGLCSLPMTVVVFQVVVDDRLPRWMKQPEVLALVFTGQVVAPVGVLSLAWLASV